MRRPDRSFSLVLVGLLFYNVSGITQESKKSDHELKLSRPASNPVLEGSVFIKGVDLKNDSPFLRVKLTDGGSRDYLIKTCDETCQKAISACTGGEQCSIRGKVEENPPSIRAEFVRVSVETKTTKSGQVFTRDRTNPKLGEAWRDPRGRIWGDIVKTDHGSPRLMTHKEATDYCKSIGAELPSREDFIRLREFMGAKSGSDEGYEPQVLPNLTYTEDGKTYGRYFWSSSVHPNNPDNAFYFHGRYGYIATVFRDFTDDKLSWRCVAIAMGG